MLVSLRPVHTLGRLNHRRNLSSATLTGDILERESRRVLFRAAKSTKPVSGMQVHLTFEKISHHINRLSKENHMTISVETEKLFEKINIQSDFLKNLRKLRKKGNFLCLIKATANAIFNGGRPLNSSDQKETAGPLPPL